MIPESALGPLFDLSICAFWLALGYWVLVYGVEQAAEQGKHDYTDDELRKWKRQGYIKWWLIVAGYSALAARAAIRFAEALSR
jgi:hypothetical protein